MKWSNIEANWLQKKCPCLVIYAIYFFFHSLQGNFKFIEIRDVYHVRVYEKNVSGIVMKFTSI